MKDENVKIVGRFFEVVTILKKAKVVRGLKTLCDRYGMNRWNVITMRDDPSGHVGTLQPAWMAALVKDYMINPLWLLTGEGDVFRDGWDVVKVSEMYRSQKEKMQMQRKRARSKRQRADSQPLTDGV